MKYFFFIKGWAKVGQIKRSDKKKKNKNISAVFLIQSKSLSWKKKRLKRMVNLLWDLEKERIRGIIEREEAEIIRG